MTDLTPRPAETGRNGPPGAAAPLAASRPPGEDAAQSVRREMRNFTDAAVDVGRKASDAGVQLAQETASQTVDAAGKGMAAGLDIQRQAADVGREMVKTGERALTHVTDFWRGAFEPIQTLQSEMNRLIEDAWSRSPAFGPLFAFAPGAPFALGAAGAAGARPATDLKETADGYSLCLELPGVEPKDVEVAIHGGALVVCGHKAEERDAHAGSFRLSERRYGCFERSFSLPADADLEATRADLKAGVLTIRIPRVAGATPSPRRTIPIAS